MSGTNKQTLVSTPNYIGAATGNSSNFKGFLKTVIVFNKILNQLQVAKL